eukprot:jgi/Tetstr1/438463/TSEL_027018.t1
MPLSYCHYWVGPQDQQLADWATHQRRRRRDGKLVAEEAPHGHCLVTTKYEPDQPLADWVFTQRRRRRIGKLAAEHERLLDGVGFDWGPARGRRRHEK